MAKKAASHKKKTVRAYARVEPVMRPLLELFASVDDVFTEEEAFSPDHIHKSLGRIYREWLNAREALDPEFDRKRYRHEMKKSSRSGLTPLGRERKPKAKKQSQRAQNSQASSMARTSISVKSPRQSEKKEKSAARKSVRSAR